MESGTESAIGLMMIMGIVLVVLAITLVPLIFYLLTLQKCLNRCSPENRAMEPGMVWLMLIPLFNFVWHFFVVNNIAKSLQLEFQKRGIAEERNPGHSIGLTMCILGACGIIPFLGALCSLAAFVCWIIYWVKIAGFSGKLAIAPARPFPAAPL